MKFAVNIAAKVAVWLIGAAFAVLIALGIALPLAAAFVAVVQSGMWALVLVIAPMLAILMVIEKHWRQRRQPLPAQPHAKRSKVQLLETVGGVGGPAVMLAVMRLPIALVQGGFGFILVFLLVLGILLLAGWAGFEAVRRVVRKATGRWPVETAAVRLVTLLVIDGLLWVVGRVAGYGFLLVMGAGIVLDVLRHHLDFNRWEPWYRRLMSADWLLWTLIAGFALWFALFCLHSWIDRQSDAERAGR